MLTGSFFKLCICIIITHNYSYLINYKKFQLFNFKTLPIKYAIGYTYTLSLAYNDLFSLINYILVSATQKQNSPKSL